MLIKFFILPWTRRRQSWNHQVNRYLFYVILVSIQVHSPESFKIVGLLVLVVAYTYFNIICVRIFFVDKIRVAC